MEFGQRPDPTRRLAGIVGVIAFHVLVVWGLVSGLARKAIEVLPSPIETKILEEMHTQEEPPPPPPPPEFEAPPPPFIPPPEITIQQRPEPSANTITTVTTQVPVAPPRPAAPKPAVRVAPVVKAANCRPPEYPPVSERLGEHGTVVLALLVGVDGKVTDSRIEKSSGYERLDKAAQVGLSRCKFTPGTVDGKPEAAWAQMKYTFKQPD